jgi:hypothetical protein
VFCPLLSSSKHSGVPKDSNSPTFPSVGLHPHTWPKWGCDTQGGVLKFPNLGLLRLWGPITFSTDLQLIWGQKQSCSSHQELSNDIWHATYTQVNRVDSRLLMIKNQTTNLTSSLSFAHNLCFRFPNGSCEPILTSTFQELSNDIKNSSIHWVLTPAIALWTLGIHWDSNSQSGSSLGSVRVYSLTLSCTPRNMWHDSWTSFLARNLATPCLGRKPKARVATFS